jgi:hypothetical protein
MVRGLVVLLLVASTGCASNAARTVLRDHDSGVVAIPKNTDAFPDYYRLQADELIQEHVGRAYEIDREEEYVLGPVTTNETQFNRRPIWNLLVPWRLAESATTTNTTSTHNQTEYRIHYRKMPTVSEPIATVEARDLPPLRDGVGGRD